MKFLRLSILCLMLTMSLGTKAQTTLDTAVNFVVTDVNGVQHNLFEYLDAGKYVVIDFFAYWCGTCQSSVPSLRIAYQNYGCNQGNVVFLAIDGSGNNAQTTHFKNTYMGANSPPAISVEGGGAGVFTAFDISSFPTYIMIAPNRAVVKKNISPFSAAITGNILTGYGVQPMACVSAASDLEDALQFEMSPNPAANLLRINLQAENYNVNIYNVMGQEVMQQSALNGQQEISIATLPVGNYVVRLNDGKNAGTQRLTIVR